MIKSRKKHTDFCTGCDAGYREKARKYFRKESTCADREERIKVLKSLLSKEAEAVGAVISQLVL